MAPDFWKSWFGPSVGGGRLIPMPRRWQGVLVFAIFVLGMGAIAAVFRNQHGPQRVAMFVWLGVFVVVANLTYDSQA